MRETLVAGSLCGHCSLQATYDGGRCCTEMKFLIGEGMTGPQVPGKVGEVSPELENQKSLVHSF